MANILTLMDNNQAPEQPTLPNQIIPDRNRPGGPSPAPMDAAAPATPGSDPQMPPAKSNRKTMVIAVVVIVVAILVGLGVLGNAKKQNQNDALGGSTGTAQTNSSNHATMLSEIKKAVTAANSSLETRTINSGDDNNNPQIIDYRDSKDYVSGVKAEADNSIFFTPYNANTIKQKDRGQQENKIIAGILTKNGFVKSDENIGVVYDEPNFPINTIYKSSEFVCQVQQADAGILDIGVGCVSTAALTKELAVIRDYYGAIQKEGKMDRTNMVFQLATRKDSKTTGYKIGKISAQIPQGSGSEYYLYAGSDGVWKIATSSQYRLPCTALDGNAEAKLAYKQEPCIAAGDTESTIQ